MDRKLGKVSDKADSAKCQQQNLGGGYVGVPYAEDQQDDGDKAPTPTVGTDGFPEEMSPTCADGRAMLPRVHR